MQTATVCINMESPAKFENGFKPRVYERRITCRTMNEKKNILLAGTDVRKLSSVAGGFSPIKIHISDYTKSLISI